MIAIDWLRAFWDAYKPILLLLVALGVLGAVIYYSWVADWRDARRDRHHRGDRS